MRSRYSDLTTIPTRKDSEYQKSPGGPQNESCAISDGVERPYTKLQRHWLTGEWQEVPSSGGVVVIRTGDGTGEAIRPRVNYERELRGLSIAPEQATPERIAQENADAKRHNTGAYYTPDGRCMTTSRRSQNRELRRKNKMNNDASYGDWAGR